MARPALLTALILSITLAACSRDEGGKAPEAAAPSADATLGPLASRVGDDGWNGAQIDWKTYEAGLAEAAAKNKPVCLILHTSWCPHCKSYRRVFSDARIVERARRFVMIELDADSHRDIAQRYTPDGAYVPRTFFLSPAGALAVDIHAPRAKYQYFYDENKAESLLAGMDQALAKLAR